MSKRLMLLAFVLLMAIPGLAQVAWTGPGPSVNVKAFGAYGDLQNNNNAVGSMGTNNITSTGTTFTNADIGKSIWIDIARFPQPDLASTNPPLLTIVNGATCTGTGGGKLENTSSYPYNVYYRITLTDNSGNQGNASFEGFGTIPIASAGQHWCAQISGVAAKGGATKYKVYFAADAPARWVANTSYQQFNTVLDSNGNIEEVTSSGSTTSGISEPIWPPVGMTVSEGTGRPTWLNLGPVVPGSASGTELQVTTAACASGNPALAQTCEIDKPPITGPAPPAVSLISGNITGGTGNMVTWSGTSLPNAINGNNFAWGHDDTTAISTALGTLTGLPGGTLFFPQTSGCYALSSTIAVAASGNAFLTLTGEGSASSTLLGGPGTVVPKPAASCIATVPLPGGTTAGFSFSTPNNFFYAGPVIEYLGFFDPLGVVAGTTTGALTFNTSASTRVFHNSFQGYAAGTAIQFNAGQPDDSTPRYNQFVEVTDNICLSVHNCVVMNGGITNPAWIERNRCVSAQTGGGRCVQLGPNIAPTGSDPPNNGGGTNWVVENFALYFPISYESVDQSADYWVANSDQETSNSFVGIVGSSGTGTGLHIGSSATGTWCLDNEVIGGNTTTHNNGTGFFIDAPCSATLYLGYSAKDGVADFGSTSNFWIQEQGMRVSAPASFASIASLTSNGSIATTQLSAPAIPTITSTGGSGTNWGYIICAKDYVGGSVCSPQGTTSGPATLSTTAYNTITWNPVAQAVSYDVWRSQAGTTPATDGLLGNVLATATLIFRDNNSAAPNPQCTVNADCSPKFNTTGSIGAPINAAGLGFFFSTGIFQAQSIGGITTGTQVTPTANVLQVVQFYLTSAITVGRITVNVTTSVASGKILVGLYDANGNKVVDSGAIDASSNGFQVGTLGPVALYPGTYYFAQTASSTSIQAIAFNTPDLSTFLNSGTSRRVGTCANTASVSGLPKVCFDATHQLTTAIVIPTLALFER